MTPHRAELFERSACVVLAIAVLVLALPETARAQASGSRSRWRGGILFDEPARDALRLDAHAAREAAATVSDALLFATLFSVLGDSLATPLAQADGQGAGSSTMAQGLALGLTLVAGDLVKALVGRARPFERACREDPSAAGCDSPDTFSSFYSLHTGVAFTSAGLSCAMHLSRSLYGDVAADAAACGVSLALAATTGLLRVASDRHYLSDVLIGAVLGFVVGYLGPLLFMPERGAGGRVARGEEAVALDAFSAAGRGTIGLTVGGSF